MKKPNYVVIFVIVVAFVYLFISLLAKAEVSSNDPQHAHLDLIEKLDLDKDGKITIKEAVAEPALLAVFGQIDTDADGKISRLELSKVRIPKVSPIKNNKVD